MYCSFTNYFQQNYCLNLLSSLENRASVIIDTKGRVRVPSINQIHKRKICKFVRKCLDGQAANFLNYFTLINHNRGTRNNKCSIRLPSIKLESNRNSFFCSGAYVYNKLPKIFVQKRILTILLIYKINLNLYSFLFISLHLLGTP